MAWRVKRCLRLRKCVDYNYIVPRSVIVFLMGFDPDFILASVEGVHELALGHEKGHEVVFCLIRHVEDQTKVGLGLKRQCEVRPRDKK